MKIDQETALKPRQLQAASPELDSHPNDDPTIIVLSDRARSKKNTVLAFPCPKLLVLPQKVHIRIHAMTTHAAVKDTGIL